MEKPLELNIKLFGAFRKYHTGTLCLSTMEGVSVSQIKNLIGQKLQELVPGFRDDELIEKSALADSRCVLNDSDCISESSDLAILPPVCGG
jgi:hypothetical protein